MSTNCLVTKFKGTVVNDNLPVYNKFIIDIPAGYGSSNIDFGMVYNGTSVACEVTGDVSIWNNSSKTTRFDHDGVFNVGSSPNQVFIDGGANGGTIILPDKYDLAYIGFGELMPRGESLDSIMQWFDKNPTRMFLLVGSGNITKYCATYTNMQYFKTYENQAFQGNLSDLALSKNSIIDVRIQNTQIGGSLANLAGPNFERLYTYNCPITGNLEDLGPATALTYMNVFGCANLGGSFENFVRAQVNAAVNPRANGSISCGMFSGTKVTFKGALVPAGESTLSWTTSGNDITITFNGESEIISKV